MTSGSLVNYIPVSVSTLGGSQSNALSIRFINGTTETPMSILTTGNVLQLSGTIEYVSSIYPRSGIFLSNVCYQDDYGRIGFNTFGPLRAQVDIVGNNNNVGLYVEQTGLKPISIFKGSGNVGIGTDIPKNKLHIGGSLYVSNNIGIGITNPTYLLELASDSAIKPGTNTWTISSDVRLKEDITIANYNECYNVLSNLDLKYYKWREDISELGISAIKDRHKLGWIAQDVENVLPKSVDIIPELYGLSNIKTLNTDQIYACMYGTIKYLINENNELKNSLNKIYSILEKNNLL